MLARKPYRCQILVDNPSVGSSAPRHDLGKVEQWMALPILILSRQLVTQHEDPVYGAAVHGVLKCLFDICLATKRAATMSPNASFLSFRPCLLLRRRIRINFHEFPRARKRHRLLQYWLQQFFAWGSFVEMVERERGRETCEPSDRSSTRGIRSKS
jgi:hypothetical protein